MQFPGIAGIDTRLTAPLHDSAATLTFHCHTLEPDDAGVDSDFQHREYGGAVQDTVSSSCLDTLTVRPVGASAGTVPAEAHGVTELDCWLKSLCMPDALVADTKNVYDTVVDKPDTIVDSTVPLVVEVVELRGESDDTGTVMLLSLPLDASTTIVYEAMGMDRHCTELVQVRFTDATSAMAMTVAGADGGCSVLQ